MSFPACISQAVLDTILVHLTPLFLIATANDPALAATTARDTLAAYNVATEPELTLAAEMISMRMNVLRALGQATEPDVSLNTAMRLRSGAVSLSREAHKSQCKLDQLQCDRRLDSPTQPAARAPDSTVEAIEAVQEAVKIAGKNNGMTWTQSFQKRQLAKRMAENFKKNSAKLAAEAAASAASP